MKILIVGPQGFGKSLLAQVIFKAFYLLQNFGDNEIQIFPSCTETDHLPASAWADYEPEFEQ